MRAAPPQKLEDISESVKKTILGQIERTRAQETETGVFLVRCSYSGTLACLDHNSSQSLC